MDKTTGTNTQLLKQAHGFFCSLKQCCTELPCLHFALQQQHYFVVYEAAQTLLQLTNICICCTIAEIISRNKCRNNEYEYWFLTAVRTVEFSEPRTLVCANSAHSSYLVILLFCLRPSSICLLLKLCIHIISLGCCCLALCLAFTLVAILWVLEKATPKMCPRFS